MLIPYKKIRKLLQIVNLSFFLGIGLFMYGKISLGEIVVIFIIVLLFNIFFKVINNRWIKIFLLVGTFFGFLNYQTIVQFMNYISSLLYIKK